jgi:general secretion pathway protein F
MPSYAYKGVSTQGRSATGVIEADSPRSARQQLRDRGVLASDLREANPRATSGASLGMPGRRVSSRDLARVLRQLATMLAAGMPLVEAVSSLLNRNLKPTLTNAFGAIRADMIAGESFERAIGKHPTVFPPIYTGMIRAGEASGALDRVLLKIADHAESSAQLQAQFRAALTYPVVMALVGSGIVIFLLAYVVPQVTRVFLEAHQALPLPTRILMGAGAFIGEYGLILVLVAAVAALALRNYGKTENGARRLEKLAFSIPWLGSVLRNVTMGRFAHTMATMTSGGLPLIEALDISRDVTGSKLVSDTLQEARTAISEGDSLAANLGRSDLFNPMVVDMIAVGERSGELETMFAKSAAALDEEVKNNVETMASLLEPVMILAMAGVVLLVVLAVLLPVFEMNQLVR